MNIDKNTLLSLAKTFDFFAELDDTFKTVFLNAIQYAKLPANSIICNQSAQCSQLGLLVSGRVRVYKLSESGKEITLYRIKPGESCVLTASCILSDINFPAFAVTEVETEALMVPTSFVNKRIAENTIWQKFIFSLVAKRLADVIEVIEEVAFKKLDSRIAKQLLYMGASNQNTIQITHQQLAGELGTSREVISRILKDFEHQGIIDVLRGKISILDRTKIKKIADVV